MMIKKITRSAVADMSFAYGIVVILLVALLFAIFGISCLVQNYYH